jgi:hypothetical protein
VPSAVPPPPRAQVASLTAQLSGALSRLGASEGEGGALREEYRALGEDMEALVRENQVRTHTHVKSCTCDLTGLSHDGRLWCHVAVHV